MSRHTGVLKTGGKAEKVYLYVTQRATENAEVGGFLLVNIWNVLLQRLETLFEVRSPETEK